MGNLTVSLTRLSTTSKQVRVLLVSRDSKCESVWVSKGSMGFNVGLGLSRDGTESGTNIHKVEGYPCLDLGREGSARG